MIRKIISFCLFITLFGNISGASSELLKHYKEEQESLLQEIAEKTLEYESIKTTLETTQELEASEHQVLFNKLEELDAFFTSANKQLKEIQSYIKKNQSRFISKKSNLFTITSFIGIVAAVGYGVKKLIDALNPKAASEGQANKQDSNPAQSEHGHQNNSMPQNSANATEQHHQQPHIHKSATQHNSTTQEQNQKNTFETTMSSAHTISTQLKTDDQQNNQHIQVSLVHKDSMIHRPQAQPREPILSYLRGWISDFIFAKHPDEGLEDARSEPHKTISLPAQNQSIASITSSTSQKPFYVYLVPKFIRRLFYKRDSMEEKFKLYFNKKQMAAESQELMKQQRELQEKQDLEQEKQLLQHNVNVSQEQLRPYVIQNKRDECVQIIFVPSDNGSAFRYNSIQKKSIKKTQLQDNPLLLITYHPEFHAEFYNSLKKPAAPEEQLWQAFKNAVKELYDDVANLFTSSDTTSRITLPTAEKKEEQQESDDENSKKSLEDKQKVEANKELQQRKLEEQLYSAHMYYGM